MDPKTRKPDVKSIVIRADRYANSQGAKSPVFDDCGRDGHGMRNFSPSSSYSQKLEKAWFLIEFADSGPKMSEIFKDTPQEQPPTFQVNCSASAIVDSSLYTVNTDSMDIQCLDLMNFVDGWKRSRYSKEFFKIYPRAAAAVGPFVYMYGCTSSCSCTSGGKKYLAYVYNTIKQEGYPIGFPPAVPEFTCGLGEIWAPLEATGQMLVTLDRATIYRHDPIKNCWEFCENYQPIPGGIDCHYSVSSDGVLYMLDFEVDPVFYLYVYDCNSGRVVNKVKIPKLLKNAGKVNWEWFRPFVVPLSSTEICFIWESLCYIFCAWVFIPPYEDEAELLALRCFGDGAIFCVTLGLPVDASLGQLLKKTSSLPLEKLSEKTKRYSTLPMFPFSKSLLNQTRTMKLKRERRVTRQKLSRRKQAPRTKTEAKRRRELVML